MKENHFNKIFWFISALTATVMAYIFAVTFIDIGKENLRFVDTALGFLLGTALGGSVSYLLGGSPANTKKLETKEDTEEIKYE